MQSKQTILKWTPYIAIVLVYICGANLDVMEVDAAQYASISLEMFKSGDHLHVLDRHEDYLDKPPLLFWLSALSFKLLGVGTWQYKLPSILFSLLGIFSTYQLGKRLYNETVGRYASWILGGSFAMIMINNDVKTDTVLVSAIVFSIWMLVSYLQTDQWKFLIGAAFGVAIAMLTKGPIGLMMPALAVGGHILLKRQWKWLFKWQWSVMLVLVGVLLIPMCIGLYEQYGTEGLRFYFWTQSFGRITGESEWRNDATPLFFTHIFLWSFLPWTLLGMAGIVKEFWNLPKSISNKHSELVLISGIVLVWTALSLSKFKLPHYIFVVYPLIAILAAKFVHDLKAINVWSWIQLTLASLASLFLAFLLIYCFPNGGWWMPIALVISVITAIVVFYRTSDSQRIMVPSFVLSIAIGLGLNLHFYPQLLNYQANAIAGKWVAEHQIPEDTFIDFASGGRALDFYAGHIVPWVYDADSLQSVISDGTAIYANEERYHELLNRGLQPTNVIVFDDFEVQKLTIRFLNPNTRAEAIRKKYLLVY